MKKAALITISSVPNYGSVLQAFASQVVLEQLGYRCKIIDYKFPNEWHYEHGSVRPRITYKIGLALGLKPHHRKTKRLNAFRQSHYHFTRPYRDLDALRREDWHDYEAVIVGSDQVWNTRFVYGDEAFMLSFVPDDVKKISMASSFACKELPAKYVDRYQKKLSRFAALSVREKNGIDIINHQLGIDKQVELLLDPTLLLSKEEWMRNVKRSSFKKTKKYLVLYGLYYAFDPRPQILDMVAHYAKTYDLDVIAIEGYEPIEGVNVVNKEDATIEEFIDIFANADLVITSSFHGTAFALNFCIPFLSLTKGDGSDDRQSSLCNMVGCNNCLPYKITPPDWHSLTVNAAVAEALFEIRKQSFIWLKNNI